MTFGDDCTLRTGSWSGKNVDVSDFDETQSRLKTLYLLYPEIPCTSWKVYAGIPTRYNERSQYKAAMG